MKTIVSSLLMILMTSSAFAAIYKFEPAKGHVSFLAVGHPSAIKIHGEGTGADGVLTDKSGVLSGNLKFNLSTLKTGIELRDHHVKDKYLEVEKFPQAELKISSLTLPKAGEVKDAPFEGTLTLKGEEKPIKGTYSTSTSGGDTKIDAQFAIRITDYKIDIPSYLGITVADNVTVQVSSTVIKSETP